MGIVIHALFYVLSAVGGVLLTANFAMSVLKLVHKQAEARRLATVLAPVTTYFRLGGIADSDHHHMPHN
ncbi:hypothetical protein [Lichenibacterium ramalinae]|uniref:Uncharacterized protein n=1 Tax=Lichenibacterium ramalinae TaxID=2316527 RepID=A0A4Q2R6P3_9HYPH|nr:hypothetical protein [Lichenibacterium ramalinae]RYB01339.1 hypothetical protein D3272_26660 [Lichenibacterium ramalinae]